MFPEGPRLRLRRITGGRTGGGGVWESNPPTRFLAGQAGFEDQSRHQSRSTPKVTEATSLGFPGQFPGARWK